jgi:hypothetical protein
MRARVLLWSSLGLNILLAGMIILLSRDSKEQFSTANIVLKGKDKPLIRTNVVLRRQAFSWHEIEAADYRAYISNLRKIGCPEKTIRDIIVADVNEAFAERMAREISVPEQKWWLPDPDLDAFEAGMNQMRALETEKNQLLADLLGPDWNVSRSASPANAIRFDGPVLSKLSAEQKTRVEQIEAAARRSQTEIAERGRQNPRGADPAELANLRQETRRQLAGVLTPEQLEEYLLRYSDTAEQMRDELRGFSGGPDEFRRIFRLRDNYEQQIAALTGNDPATRQRRGELERLRDRAISQSIGPERFSLYQLTQNPLFRAAQEQAEVNGAPPEKVLPIFEVNRATQLELQRIAGDRNLSEDQRRILQVTVQQQQRNSIERILASAPEDDTVGQGTAEPTPAQARTPVPAVFPPFPPPPPGIFVP